MTNREALLHELGQIPAGVLAEKILDDRLMNLGIHINDLRCEDCYREHDGRCVASEEDAKGVDAKCPLTLAEWLDRPCTRESLLKGWGG